jgi:hypothetical protein
MLKKLIDYLPDMTDGLFTAFNNPVWAKEFQDSEELDTYFYLRYGDRIGNKLIAKFADEDGVVDTKKQQLAKMVYNINAKKWEHLFNVYLAEYNPIENTDFIETITDTDSNTRIVDTENSNTRVVDGAISNSRVIDNDITNSRVIDTDTTSSGTATTESSGESSGENETENNKFGFNSVSAVGDTTSSGSDSNSTSASSETTTSGSTSEDSLITDTGTNDSTITDNGTEDSTITDNGSEDSTITDNGLHTSEHRKHGNIGVTTNTTMLTEEVKFWKWSFIDSVCADICDIIALSIY